MAFSSSGMDSCSESSGDSCRGSGPSSVCSEFIRACLRSFNVIRLRPEGLAPLAVTSVGSRARGTLTPDGASGYDVSLAGPVVVGGAGGAIGVFEFDLTALLPYVERPTDVLDHPAPTRRAQKFPEAASFRIALSNVRSATTLFSRPFSRSSSRSRFA